MRDRPGSSGGKRDSDVLFDEPFPNNEEEFGHVFEDKLIECTEVNTTVLLRFTDDDGFKSEMTKTACRYARTRTCAVMWRDHPAHEGSLVHRDLKPATSCWQPAGS